MLSRTIMVVLALFVCSFVVRPSVAIGADTNSDKPDKVTVCHHPGEHEVTIEIASAAVDAHLEHGDKLGECGIVFTPCSNGWETYHTDEFITYYLEVDYNRLDGMFLNVNTVGYRDTSISVTVTSLSTGNVWIFDTPSCGTGCGYLFDWYGEGTTHPLGGGDDLYQVDVRQANEGLVYLSCVD